MTAIYSANSIIEREALLAALREVGIECDSPKRDVSRQITANTIDLAYEGFSAMKKDTFPILVDEAKQKQALEIINQIVQSVESVPQVRSSYLSLFRAACFFTAFVPVIFHLVALYNLVMYFKSDDREKEKFLVGRNIAASIVALVTIPITYSLLEAVVIPNMNAWF